MKKLLFLLLAASLCSSIAYAIGHYNNGDTLNVFAISGLQMRGEPGSGVIAIVP